MKMPPRSQQASEAMLFGHHLETRTTPEGQRNNPMNARGLMPMELESSNPYGDGRIARSVNGLMFTPAAQQQIVVHPAGSKPGGDNPVVPGHPEQIAPTKLLEQLGSPLRTTTTAMSASQQGLRGNPQAAIERGIPGELAMKPMPRRSGFDTRRPGAMRSIGG
jgi:hypothetical protein